MAAAILERTRHAPRAQPRRREHGRRRGLGAARRGRTGRADGRRHRPVRGGRVLAAAGGRRSCTRARCCWATCSATSSTATASSTRSPTAGPRWWRPSPRARSSCSTPTTRSSPTSAATARDVAVLRRRRRRARAARAAARRRLQALPPLRRTPTSTTPPTSATWAATTARTAGPAAPSRRRSPRATSSCDGVRAARFTLRTPGRARPRSTSPSPASTTSTTRSARPRWPRPRRARSTTSSPAWRRWRPPSAAPRRSSVGGRDLVVLLVKNPAGANEVLRTLVLEDGQLDLLGLLNDHIADGRDVSWVWDADFELLAAARAPHDLRRAPAPPSWRADEVRGRRPRAARASSTTSSGRSTRAAAGDAARPLYALPTYTALLELRELLARRGVARESFGMSDVPCVLARPRVRRLRRGPAAVARARRACPADGPRPRRGRAGWRSTSPRRGHAVTASTRPGAARGAARARARGLPVGPPCGRRARASTSARRFALVHRPDADHPAPGRRPRAAPRCCARARRAPAPGRPVRRRGGRRARGLRRRGTRRAARCPTWARYDGWLYSSASRSPCATRATA